MIHPAVGEEAHAEILRRLSAAEAQHDVKVLWAIESGSRAWGFASPNSDFDCRFIYVHRPDWYLSIGERRDVIEYPIVDEMDINGWDLRKALRLLLKSNPGIVEWLLSPIVYRHHTEFAASARAILAQSYSVAAGIAHYRSTAKSNFREYLQAPEVPLKKYFYVLRPLLAARWLERHQQPAPIEFEQLLAMVSGEHALLAAIHRLLDAKRAAPETGRGPQVPEIDAFIRAELQRLEQAPLPPKPHADTESALSALFRQILADAWA